MREEKGGTGLDHMCDTAAKRALHAAGKSGRRHHWRLAASLAPDITDTMVRGWFLQFFMEGERLPMSPRRRMLWLVEVRAGFQMAGDSLGVLMVSAALWREATRIRRTKRLRRHLRHFTHPISHDHIDKTVPVPMLSRADGPREGITGNSVRDVRTPRAS